MSNAPSQPTKMRGSDGRVLGTFNVGNGVFWLTGRTSGPRMGLMELSKIRASDGKTLGTFTVGTGPIAIAFDGQNVWVTNYGSGNVTELRASDGSLVRSVTIGANAAPPGIAFDGANMWVANRAAAL